VYEKLDGSNILRFAYTHEGKTYITYKTRLSPFLRKNVYQDFKGLWDKMLEKYPIIKTLPPTPFRAFELYGYMNPIVVKYTTPLNTAFLYFIDANGRIIPPTHYEQIPLPVRHWYGDINEPLYKDFEIKAEEQYVKDKSIEGFMMYQEFEEGVWTVSKCKSISLLNDSHEHVISKDEIHTTALNALEIIMDLNELLAATLKLLVESYPIDYIDFHKEMITIEVNKLLEQIEEEHEVMRLYKKLELDIKADKRKTMQEMMMYYPKSKSSFVYSTIMKLIEYD
jgi:hypothetical protein